MSAQRPSLLERLWTRLPETLHAVLRLAIELAEGEGCQLFLVGGGVRDLLLSSAHFDLDLVVEGDGPRLARCLGASLDARVVAHQRFGTAVVRGDGFRLDLATARAERYERPGALPTVRPASLADDLVRRDFTSNALALRLTGPKAGELLDPYGGQADLRRRLVRVLREESFQEDATRILRALRYAGRLGFRLEPRTRRLLKRDLPCLQTISGARLRHEFERIAEEERAPEVLRLAERTGALAAVHPALRAGAGARRALRRLAEVSPAHRAAALFCLLLTEVSRDEAEAALERLALTGRQAEAVRGFLALRDEEARLAQPALQPSEAVRLLSVRPIAAVEAFALWSSRRIVRHRARRYLEQWRLVRPRLTGRDLQALGVPRGPLIGAALAALRAARLDGEARTREDETALVWRLGFARRYAEAGHG